MISGLILFTRGFLLNRISRLEVGECDTVLQSCDKNCSGGINYADLFTSEEPAAKTCLGRQAKVVLLIIDALRYDFIKWNDDLTPENASYYQNKLPVVKEALENHQGFTTLHKFIADPPTTTMQRLKGLTTGTLPTFIDAGSNFATEDINEDNIINQASSQGVVFMGDDTWMGLYPDKFIRQYPYPSFNVWDLDTVDRGIEDKIYEELKRNDWSLLVAHTLGVDHAGHRYGPHHPEMERKLEEMNVMIGKLIENLQEDTMLIVVGDHGMTSTGDHGGDTTLETEAGMFVYSNVPLLGKKFGDNLGEVHQIDLVPTLAAILGIPIPFSNLGSVILEILPRNYHKNTDLEDFQYALHSLWSNVVQTRNYLETYSSESSLFPEEKLHRIRTKYDAIHKRVRHVHDIETFKYFAKDAKAYLKTIRDMCVEVWVQFDSDLMTRGLVLTFFTIIFAYIIVNGIPRDRIPEVFQSSFLFTSIIANLAVTLFVFALFLFDFITEFVNAVLFANGVASVFTFALLVVQNWDTIYTNWYNTRKTRVWFNHSSKLILLLTVCGLFSNSYIIEEALVLSFLLITMIWILVINVKNTRSQISEKRPKSGLKSYFSTLSFFIISLGLVSTTLIRFSSYFWSCRDGQAESCNISDFRKSGANLLNTSSRAVVIITVVIIALFVTVLRTWLNSCGNLSGFSPSVTGAKYLPGIIVVCMGGYWVLQHVPKSAKVKFIRPWQVDMLTWVIYFCVVIGNLVLFISPLLVYLLPKRKESLNVYGRENIIPQLFNGMKSLIYRKKETENESTPVVYGLGTAYSATFVSLSVFLTLLCTLLLGNNLAPSIIVMYAVCICVLVLSAVERYQHATNIS